MVVPLVVRFHVRFHQVVKGPRSVSKFDDGRGMRRQEPPETAL